MDSKLVFHSSLVQFSRMIVRLGKTIMGKHKYSGEESEDIYEDKTVSSFKHLDPYCKGKPVEEYEQHFHCPLCGRWEGPDISQEVS